MTSESWQIGPDLILTRRKDSLFATRASDGEFHGLEALTRVIAYFFFAKI